MRVEKDTSFNDGGVMITVHESNEAETCYQLTIRNKMEEHVSFYITMERYKKLKEIIKEVDIYFSDIQ